MFRTKDKPRRIQEMRLVAATLLRNENMGLACSDVDQVHHDMVRRLASHLVERGYVRMASLDEIVSDTDGRRWRRWRVVDVARQALQEIAASDLAAERALFSDPSNPEPQSAPKLTSNNDPAADGRTAEATSAPVQMGLASSPRLTLGARLTRLEVLVAEIRQVLWMK